MLDARVACRLLNTDRLLLDVSRGRLITLAVITGVVLSVGAFYSALPAQISPIALSPVSGTERAEKIIDDRGGSVSRLFALPPAPTGIARLGIALRPATYLRPPSGTIEVTVGNDRCRYRARDYTDAGTITCPISSTTPRRMRVTVTDATGPFALIERETRPGTYMVGSWVQRPPQSLSGRVRFVLTALSSTRAGLYGWPLAVFGFAFATIAGIGLSIFALLPEDDEEEVRSAIMDTGDPEHSGPV